MLEDEDKSFYCSILINTLFTQEEYSKPVHMKMKSLKILLSIIPSESLLAMTGKSHNELL